MSTAYWYCSKCNTSHESREICPLSNTHINELIAGTQLPPRVAYDTIIGDHYEGTLIEIDNGTAIIQLDNGETRAAPIEGVYEVEDEH